MSKAMHKQAERRTRITRQHQTIVESTMAGGIAAMLAGEPVERKKSMGDRMKGMFATFGLHSGLVVGCIAYVCIGALLFRHLERPNEINVKAKTLKTLDELIHRIVNETVRLRIKRYDETKFHDETEQLLDEYHQELFQLFDHPISANVLDAYFENETYRDLWTFSSAILFTSTTMVPVGFGLVTPLTWEGRLALVCYALIGIPLALVTMSDLGRFLCNWISQMFGEHKNIFFVFLLLVVVAYPICGGLVISHLGDLSIVDGIYYSSITILTVGFGDMSPPIPVPFLIMYIIFGVMLVTISVEVVAANAIHNVHFMGRQLGNARVLATRMITMAQKISISKGLGLGMAQLGAFARIGLIQMDGYEDCKVVEDEDIASVHTSVRTPLLTAPFDPPVQLSHCHLFEMQSHLMLNIMGNCIKAWIDWPSDFYQLSFDMDTYRMIDQDSISEDEDDDKRRREIELDSLSDFIIKTSLSPMEDGYQQAFI